MANQRYVSDRRLGQDTLRLVSTSMFDVEALGG
jgi:hypothetical protein